MYSKECEIMRLRITTHAFPHWRSSGEEHTLPRTFLMLPAQYRTTPLLLLFFLNILENRPKPQFPEALVASMTLSIVCLRLEAVVAALQGLVRPGVCGAFTSSASVGRRMWVQHPIADRFTVATVVLGVALVATHWLLTADDARSMLRWLCKLLGAAARTYFQVLVTRGPSKHSQLRHSFIPGHDKS